MLQEVKRGVVGAGVGSAVSVAPAPPPPQAALNEIGSLLVQRYEVVRELGRGGMGIVYLCRDVVTGEQVALKRLRPPEDAKTPARPEESWWFQQEARAIAALDHPAIVRARDFGSLADGTPYLVMDVLPGRSVHEWMHTTKLAWPVVWALVDQVLAGLGHAHARGVIHGDMKPSNVMLDLGSNGPGPRAYILDLGLAWLKQSRHDPRLDGAPAPEPAVHSGAGTVGWVAPEQIRKAATHVGPPTDLYALGCIVYRVLVGKEVFEGSAQDVLRAHKRTAVAPLTLSSDVPAGVSAYVQRLLAKRPWHRFDLAADARRAWAEFRPVGVAAMEDMGEPPSMRPPRAHGAVAAARSLAPGLLTLRQSPLVGREPERRELLATMEEVCSGLTPQRLIVLIGEAGVGKSRLAEWLSEQVHEHGKMMPLRARYGRIATPLDGVTGAVNAHYGLEGANHALVEQTIMNRWEVLPSDDDALSWVSATAEWLRPTPPGTLAPLGPSGKRFILDTPEQRWGVIRRVLERIAADRPVLVWFDDLHLASPNTFEMLARLRRDATELRIMIVATARSEALETDLDAALRMEAMRSDWNGKVIELKLLAAPDTDELLRATLPLNDDAVARASEQSRGNPLFALQLVHAWAGGGYLKLEGGEYRVPEDALRGRAITTAELWDERLRAVPTELRLSAYAAAALGEDIRGNVLRALVSSLGMDARDAMSSLTQAQILLPGGNDQFRWPHALLQEHLLQRLHDRNDAPAVFRIAANALTKHPAVGSRRIMKHRVLNLLRAGDDDIAAALMFRFISGSWRRGRDTAATLGDLQLLEGRVSGPAAAEYALWKAEALRHMGRLDEARDQADAARGAFAQAGDAVRAAHAKRLLGHIASDVGAPALGRVQVEDAYARFEALGDEPGKAQAQVVLGEIDYLLGDHVRARAELLDASARCSATGDVLGRAQCLILLALTETAAGRYRRARALLTEARAEFERIGYQLGLAQCDVALGHADYRAFEFEGARAHALTARASFRELTNPRGEAACERLLSMVAFDTDDLAAASAHAEVAATIFDSLHDPWGDLESKLLLAQVALASGDAKASPLVAACDAIQLDEAEPRQHRHLTRAWLAQREGRWVQAEEEVDQAHHVFRGDWTQTGDHTPALLKRLSRLTWSGGAPTKIDLWLRGIEGSEAAPKAAPSSEG